MQKLPFSLTTRGDSPYYYVRFRNETTGSFMTWISTKEKNYNRALRKAWDLYNQKAEELATESYYDTLRKASYSKEDVAMFLEDFKRKGFLSGYVLNDSELSNAPALQWFIDFWNPETSEYLREKKRKGQNVHKKHTGNSAAFVRKYWPPILQEKRLGELGRQDIQAMFDKLDRMELNGNTKNHILRSVLTPLKWAYNNEVLSRDLSKGWVMYKTVYKRRAILTMEMARNVFRVPWDNEFSKLASMLAMCTGMRAGEILALTLDDLGEDCIYIRHSFSLIDGLKCTKNGESRTVYVPFPFLMQKLRDYGETNPHPNGSGFIFWGMTPDKPMDPNGLRRYFRRALVLAGMDKEDAKQMTFHAWRHFYATYMSDKVNQKALQGQTGHKTQIMLEHYAAHQTKEEAKLITQAQYQLFGAIMQ